MHINLLTIVLRLGMAALIGGIIGLQRETTKQAAGFRTHMLICMGSALAMLTNQFVFESISSNIDPTRIGAQVISGIGFLGVGTIIVVGKNHVKGLTTAAGLWASACMGLAIGIGFYMGALVGAIFIFIIIAVLQRIDSLIAKIAVNMDMYLELKSSDDIAKLLDYFKKCSYTVTKFEMNRVNTVNSGSVGVDVALKLPRGTEHLPIITDLAGKPEVIVIQEV
jgi:putative Mg2+ transporter-C (MgtC) family protein